MRQSDIAYVLIKLRARGQDWLLLHRHARWGDWSLVGGHVEAGEEEDWLRTAFREAGEELAPLQAGGDFDIEPLGLERFLWGPEPSKSAGGEPTRYRAQYFLLRFRKDPERLLATLPEADFCMFPAHHVASRTEVSQPIRLLAERLGEELAKLPFSWNGELSAVPRTCPN